MSHLKAERDLEKAAMTLESESSLARLMAKVEELQTSFVKESRDRAEAESSLKAEFEERLRAQHSNLHASARRSMDRWILKRRKMPKQHVELCPQDVVARLYRRSDSVEE